VFGSAKGKTKPTKEKDPEWDQSFVLVHKEVKETKDKQVLLLDKGGREKVKENEKG
jgi:hypothetical protein